MIASGKYYRVMNKMKEMLKKIEKCTFIEFGNGERGFYVAEVISIRDEAIELVGEAKVYLQELKENSDKKEQYIEKIVQIEKFIKDTYKYYENLL